jgi:hypothetical protein
MAKIIPITEHFQHFVEELKEGLGRPARRGAAGGQEVFRLLSERQRDRYMVSARYGRSSVRQDHRNGYYLRPFVTRFETLRLRIARSRRAFLPEVMAKFRVKSPTNYPAVKPRDTLNKRSS